MDKYLEMSNALTEAGYPGHHIRSGVINTLSGSVPTVSYEVDLAWMKFLAGHPGLHKFDTFDEMYKFCINIKPRNEILYRQFSLAA